VSFRIDRIELHFLSTFGFQDRYVVSTQPVYVLPKIVEMVAAELSLEEKLALVPEAPAPVLPYSWNVALAVFGVLVLHCSHPAPLIIAPKTVF